MNISKTLFKVLTRCQNAPSLYNMYINRGFHDVKEINGLDIENLKRELATIKDNEFDDELSDLESQIFNGMFDENTGEDLTILTSAQLEAFKDIFTEVEYLAGKYVEKIFNFEVQASKNTYDQKKFEYHHNGNKYYCYVDIYSKQNNKLRIFEVKSTTSSKIDDLHFVIKRGKEPYYIYKKNIVSKIMDCCLENYIETNLDGVDVSEKFILDKLQNALNKYSSVGKYLYDVAIQRHIIEQSFLSIGESVPEIEYYLVTLNHEYVYDGYKEDNCAVYNTVNGQDLFKIYDVNYFTKIYQEQIIKERNLLDQRFQHLTIVNNCLGDHCQYKKNDQCKFFKICHEPVLIDGTIFDYTNKNYCFKHPTNLNKSGNRQTINIYDLINNKIYSMKEALPYITEIDQLIEYDCYQTNKQYIDKDNLKFLIDKIEYPIYHLDFESYNSPLPRFFGEKPYSQSLFQYSLHVEKRFGYCEIDNKNGMFHYEYLAPDHNDHRRDIALKLIEDINLENGGTVLAYHAVFEKTRIYELMKFYPDLSDKLKKIYDAIFDLEDVIHASKNVYLKYDSNYNIDNKPKFNFYDKELHASFSIKKLLPIFTDLTYKDLEVQNGTEAILVYGLLPTLTDLEYQNKYLALRKYCRQDTWSMVKILQGLIELIK